MSVNEGDTISIATMPVQDFLQMMLGKIQDTPENPAVYFSGIGYNPTTKQRFEVTWGLTVVDIKIQEQKKLN